MKQNSINVAWIAASFFLCCGFLLRLPSQFESRGILLTDQALTLLLYAFVFLTLKAQSWHWKVVGLILAMTIFLLPLVRLWQTASSNFNVIFGLFPYSDAAGYFLDANQFLHGHLFSTFSGRRPLFASLLAILLWLMSGNLQEVLLLFSGLAGAAAHLLALEIRARIGPLAGIFVLVLARLFYTPFVGATLTEQLGFPLGLAAMAMLINAVSLRKKWRFAAGLLLTLVALLARAGAFFILPALFIYGIFIFETGLRPRLRIGFIFGIALLIPVLFNSIVGRMVASPSSVPFGNFSDTLYGQAVGGKGWLQISEDYPDIFHLPEPNRSQEIYRLAFAEMSRNPLGLVRGIIKSWLDFVRPQAGFAYFTVGNQVLDLIFQFAAAGLFWAGCWLLWNERKKPLAGLSLAALLGTFLSIPFLPLIDAGLRPYAATIAWTFTPLLMTTAWLAKDKRKEPTSKLRSNWEGVAFSICLALPVFIFVGTAIMKWIPQQAVTSLAVCANGQSQVVVGLNPGSYISLTDNNPGTQTRVPVVMLKDVLRSFSKFPIRYAEVFRQIQKPAFVTLAFDQVTSTDLWLIGPPEMVAEIGHKITICGRVDKRYPNVFRVQTFSMY